MMTINRCKATAAAAMLLTTMLGAGCETVQSDVTWQLNGVPRHDNTYRDWWHYQVVYHPDTRTYFDPYRQTYFWYQDGGWQQGRELPQELIPRQRWMRVVRLRTQTPFVQHDTMAAMNPTQCEPVAGFLPPSHPTYEDMPAMMATEPTDGP